MRSRAGGLPELELIALDEEEPSPRAQAIEVKSKRWWPVALVGMLVAGAIVATGQGSSVDTAAEVTVPPLPSTRFTPASTTVPTARRAADAQRRAYPAVLLSSDATTLLVLSEGGAFEVDVADAPDTIAGYVARPPATVVTLTNGLVRAYSRMYPEGIDLGSARAVFPSQDPRRVWLTGVIEGESAVKEMPVDGTVPPQLATGFIALPDNSSVVGVAGGELVLSVRTDLSEPYELVTWDPATRTTEFIARAATLVAAGEGRIAWVRNGCESCGIYVRRDGVMRVVNGISNHDPSVPGTFSPDGRFLALAITGSWPGGGAGAIVHGVDRRRPRPAPPRPWAPCALARARRHARHTVDGSGRDDLVGWRRVARPRRVRPGSGLRAPGRWHRAHVCVPAAGSPPGADSALGAADAHPAHDAAAQQPGDDARAGARSLIVVNRRRRVGPPFGWARPVEPPRVAS